MSLQDGLKALQEQHYAEAIALLISYCQSGVDRRSPYFIQAQIALARAYRGNNELDKAIALCEKLRKYPQKDVHNWASNYISLLKSQENSGFFSGMLDGNSSLFKPEKAGRGEQKGVKLLKPKVADSLAFASFFTLAFMGGMLTGLIFFLDSLIGFLPNLTGLGVALATATFILSIGFALSPWLMDLLQQSLYQVQWENLTTIREHSAESAEVILQVGREKSLKFPRLGVIDSPIPIAFSYGSFLGLGRIVVSQGLFTYLDEEEIATVYAYELANLLHWNRSIITLAALPVILLNWVATQLMRGLGTPLAIQFLLRISGRIFRYLAHFFTFPIIYLSRTRTYYADQFASEVTGNPNGLVRGLVKSAYGMMETKNKATEPNYLEIEIRPLNFYDAYHAVATGTAYRQNSASQRIGQVFLWELYNPWAWWLELISTHPLTGRRVGVLTQYAEQMELDTEFSMSSVFKEGKKLNRHKLILNFALDWLTLALPVIGLLIGIKLPSFYENFTIFQGICWGFGVGILFKTLLVYPFAPKNLVSSDIFHLMSDAYASPVRGQPVTLKGKLMAINSNLRLQDPTGMMITHYRSRLGELIGLKSLKSFVNVPVRAVGWFYRGVMPCLDLSQLDNAQHRLCSYHRFRSLMLGAIAIIIGLFA